MGPGETGYLEPNRKKFLHQINLGNFLTGWYSGSLEVDSAARSKIAYIYFLGAKTALILAHVGKKKERKSFRIE